MAGIHPQTFAGKVSAPRIAKLTTAIRQVLEASIEMGGTTLRALWVPGHTQGATVWITSVSEGGKNYSVAFRGGEIPNAGVQLIGNPRHPKVIEDTKMTLQRMKALQPPDLFLHNHRQNLGRPLDPSLPVNPLCVTCMDAEAYKVMVANAERSFAERVREAEAQPTK